MVYRILIILALAGIFIGSFTKVKESGVFPFKKKEKQVFAVNQVKPNETHLSGTNIEFSALVVPVQSHISGNTPAASAIPPVHVSGQ